MTYTIFRRHARKAVMLKVLGASGLILALLFGLRSAALAQSLCMPHAEMAKQLDDRFSETQVAIAIASTGSLVEVFSTGSGSTWTIVTTRPDGTSCVVATGEAWVERRRAVEGPTV